MLFGVLFRVLQYFFFCLATDDVVTIATGNHFVAVNHLPHDVVFLFVQCVCCIVVPSLRQCTNLLHQRQHVEVVPALLDLAAVEVQQPA
jgi:hypothetical protein